MIRLTTYCEASSFLQDTRGWLEPQIGLTDLILGLALGLVNQPQQFGGDPFFAAGFDKGLPVMAALMTPPHRLILHGDEPLAGSALELLLDSLLSGGWPVNGCLGPVGVSEAFAQIWSRRMGVAWEPGVSQRSYVLRSVEWMGDAPGRLRLATPDDIDLVLGWLRDYWEEAVPGRAPDDRRRIEARLISGCYWLWEDGGPVAMASKTRPTRTGVSISGVYTPPHYRCCGYATACVAALSRQLLAEGFDYCALFTDLANPTSNHIYQQIGFKPVADFQEYRFAG